MEPLPDLDAAGRDGVRAAVPGLAPIGYVRSTYTDPAQTPIQSTRNGAAVGRVEVFAEFAAGLDGVREFDHLWIVAWLDRAEPTPSDGRVVPFMLAHTGQRVGIFATRHPARPNPLALSVVRVLDVDETGVTFAGVDLCHGTPVLDVKPWQQHLDIPRYSEGWEAISSIRGGWYQQRGVAGTGQTLPDPGRPPE
ncbi:tRNA (N6-threonylcarbamoyladenosine(37)-N6)-methyltransferase TrmO [Pseudonocardia sp. GCM10023141]|uniref:tRNA (N6-threonylcarbamoyladenosine(37)-N6)-methyltransferase TrmO n=1 Tax=Pseudonocardia sp. GCM10023141 TaxID=3252653 RepID=UPI0036175EFE